MTLSGRLIYWNIQTKLLAHSFVIPINGTVSILQANPQRIYLAIWSQTSNGLVVIPTCDNGGQAQIPINAGVTGLVVEQHFDKQYKMTQLEWIAINGAVGVSTLSVFESLYLGI